MESTAERNGGGPRQYIESGEAIKDIKNIEDTPITPYFNIPGIPLVQNQAPVDGSRLAQTNIPNPVSMRGEPTGGMNPQTMAKGQQLFNKPGEITFANQGGIMSTNKAFQRVA